MNNQCICSYAYRLVAFPIDSQKCGAKHEQRQE